MDSLDNYDLVQVKLGEIISQFDEVEENLRDRLSAVVMKSALKMTKPNTKSALNIITVFENTKNNVSAFEEYINLVHDENGAWQLQVGKRTTYTKALIQNIDVLESVYYMLDGKLMLDTVEKKIIENCGEQKVNYISYTYILEDGEWKQHLLHTIIYFEDTETHEVVVLDSQNVRLSENNNHYVGTETDIPLVRQRKS